MCLDNSMKTREINNSEPLKSEFLIENRLSTRRNNSKMQIYILCNLCRFIPTYNEAYI